MTEHDEDKESESFIRYGTEEQKTNAEADEILNAIAEGRSVDVEHAVLCPYVLTFSWTTQN